MSGRALLNLDAIQDGVDVAVAQGEGGGGPTYHEGLQPSDRDDERRPRASGKPKGIVRYPARRPIDDFVEDQYLDASFVQKGSHSIDGLGFVEDGVDDKHAAGTPGTGELVGEEGQPQQGIGPDQMRGRT